MVFDENRLRVASRRRLHGPLALVASLAVVVLGVALVLGGAFEADPKLRLGAGLGLSPTTTGLSPSGGPPSEGSSLTTVETTSTTTAVVTTSITDVITATTAAAATTTAKPAPTTTRPPTTEPTPATTSATPATPATPATTSAPRPSTTTPPDLGITRNGSVEAALLRLTNDDRSAAGLGTLTRNSCMDSAASQWAAHMAETGEKAHSTKSGALVQGCRGANASWGDNIGWWDPCSAADMENWWMNSPSHKSNIVNPNFKTIGIAVSPGVQGYCWFQVLFGS